jgi:hypothetical protein
MGRSDLIGNGKHQLIPTYQPIGTGRAHEGQRKKPQARPFRTQHTGLPQVPTSAPGPTKTTHRTGGPKPRRSR